MGARVTIPSTDRRSRRWLVLVGVAVLVVVISGMVTRLARRDETPSTSAGAPASSMPTRTITAGAVIIKIEPRQLDAGGAVFKVTFDTHSVDLDQDLERQARLTVGATTWPVAGWSGDGPGGHHRTGELRFTAAGAPTGTATLDIDGLPETVHATWNL